jgi:hypothetical protein
MGALVCPRQRRDIVAPDQWGAAGCGSGRSVGGDGVGGAPHVPGGDGAVGGPFGADFGGFGGLWRGFEVVADLHAFLDAEVADGEDVGAAEVGHEEHVGGPLADAFYGDEVGDDFVVGVVVDVVEVEIALEGVAGEVAEVAGFLSGDADGAEGVIVGGGEFSGGWGAGLVATLICALISEVGVEASLDGAGSGAGELLEEDGTDELGVGVGGGAGAVGAVFVDEAADDGVDTSEVSVGGGGGESEAFGHRWLAPRVDGSGEGR